MRAIRRTRSVYVNASCKKIAPVTTNTPTTVDPTRYPVYRTTVLKRGSRLRRGGGGVGESGAVGGTSRLITPAEKRLRSAAVGIAGFGASGLLRRCTPRRSRSRGRNTLVGAAALAVGAWLAAARLSTPRVDSIVLRERVRRCCGRQPEGAQGGGSERRETVHDVECQTEQPSQ